MSSLTQVKNVLQHLETDHLPNCVRLKPILQRGLSLKPATHLAILYADRCDRLLKTADIWHVRYPRLNSPVFAKCARSRDFLRSSLRITMNSTNHVGQFYHLTFQNSHIASIREKIAKFVRINRGRKSLAIFAGDQILRDRRIKSPGVSPPLG